MTPEQREALVERIAEQIYHSLDDASEGGDYVGQYKWIRGFTRIDGNFDLKVIARAALSIAEEEIERGLIEEMMEPSEAMIAAAELYSDDAVAVWQAMLRTFHSSRGE